MSNKNDYSWAENKLLDYRIIPLSSLGVEPVVFRVGKNICSLSSQGKVSYINREGSPSVYDNGRGYKYIQLWCNTEKKNIRVYLHRLVALCFIPNPEKLEDVNHIDFNKENNEMSNLEWMSRTDNMKHAWLGGRFSNKANAEALLRKDWIGKSVGNRVIIALVDRQAKAGNFYVKVKCIICGNDNIIMAQNDFMKNKVKRCSKCKYIKFTE